MTARGERIAVCIHLKLVSLLVITVALSVSACGAPSGSGSGAPGTAARTETGTERGFKGAVARFQHETCTFCPGGDMGIDDWTRIRPPFGGEALLDDDDTYVQGFVKMARVRRHRARRPDLAVRGVRGGRRGRGRPGTRSITSST